MAGPTRSTSSPRPTAPGIEQVGAGRPARGALAGVVRAARVVAEVAHA